MFSDTASSLTVFAFPKGLRAQPFKKIRTEVETAASCKRCEACFLFMEIHPLFLVLFGE